MKRRIVLEKLKISPTTFQSICGVSISAYSSFLGQDRQLTLELNLILYHEGLALVFNGLIEFGRDSVMGSNILDNFSSFQLAFGRNLDFGINSTAHLNPYHPQFP